MAKFSKGKEEVESTVWKPTKFDVQKLEENLKKFEKKEVNGKKQYPFELYLEDEGIISFGEFGQIQIRNPIMYERMNKTDSLREWIEKQEMEKSFNAFPEEREAYNAKRKERLASFKKVDKSLKTA